MRASSVVVVPGPRTWCGGADRKSRAAYPPDGGVPLGRRLASALVWLVIALVAVLWLLPTAVVYLATAHRDPGRYAVGRCFRLAAAVCVRLNPFWDFRVSGVRIADPRRPYVGVSNHESMADVFLLGQLPWEMKWLSKEEVFRLPVLGWMMRMAGDIAVRRDHAGSRAAALDEVRDRLRKRVSVMIMPEGTRSRTGEVLPFRDGAFRVAVEAGAPILPVAVAGTRDSLPRGSLLFRRARGEARVLAPVATAGLTQDDVPELRDRVREMIVRAREEMLEGLGARDAPGR
jgi:1-acyl-sn-glycerol-3-phosphate acyltransferase